MGSRFVTIVGIGIAFALLVAAPNASAATLLYYDGTMLQGYTDTNVTAGVVSEGCIETEAYVGYPWPVPALQCEAYEVVGARVDSYLYSPSWIPEYYDSEIDVWSAADIYSVSPGEYGTWTAIGDHFAQMIYYAWYCIPEGYPGAGCANPIAFDAWDEFLGQTSAQAYVPAPPQYPAEDVVIEYTMIIPLDHVAMPNFPIVGDVIYAGDGVATYSGMPEEYRVQQVFTVDLATQLITSHVPDSGVTHEFYPALIPEYPHGPVIKNPEVLSSEISCYRKFCPECPSYPLEPMVYSGYCHVDTAAANCSTEATDMHTLDVVRTDYTATSMKVRFSGDPGNACVAGGYLAADISWLNYLEFSWDGQQWLFRLEMEHDGFPRHEVRINGQLVYHMDPIDENQTPLSLAWPRDWSPPPVVGVLP